LQTSLNKNLAQSFEELSKTLNVNKLNVFLIHLYLTVKIQKIQKEGKWVIPYKLVIQNRLTICTSLLSCHKKKQFLYENVTGDKKMDLL